MQQNEGVRVLDSALIAVFLSQQPSGPSALEKGECCAKAADRRVSGNNIGLGCSDSQEIELCSVARVG